MSTCCKFPTFQVNESSEDQVVGQLVKAANDGQGQS